MVGRSSPITPLAYRFLTKIQEFKPSPNATRTGNPWWGWTWFTTATAQSVRQIQTNKNGTTQIQL
jgi:hypothetical protein